MVFYHMPLTEVPAFPKESGEYQQVLDWYPKATMEIHRRFSRMSHH